MTKDQAIEIIWDYMHLNHSLAKAGVIIALGSRDIRVAEYAATLWLDGWAPYLVCSGSGSIHNHKPGREKFIGSTEAEIFAQVAINLGVPESVIIIENKSQNTGQNLELSLRLLAEKHINVKSVIAVHKPYVERRAFATGKVWLPETVNLIVTSPPIMIKDYPDQTSAIDEHWIHTMVGDLQRIKEYPAKGFQIPQEIPDFVWEAYEYMISNGYNKRLIKD